MLRHLLAIFLLVVSLETFAQQDHFVYLQSEDRQPFYAKISSQVFSSSENGYLIIPKLVEGNYQIDIGFARSAFPEQHFIMQVNKKDLGFQLKNLGQKGWGLTNLRNGEVLENKDAGSAMNEFTGAKKTDAFSAMLANVVNDSSILYSAVKTTPPPAKPAPAPVAQTTPPETGLTAAVDSAKEEAIAKATTPAVVNADSARFKNAQPDQQSTAVKLRPDSQAIVSSNRRLKQNNVPDSQAVVVNPNPPAQKQPVTTSPNTVLKPQTETEVVATNTASKKTPPSNEKPFITRISEATGSESYDAIFLEQYNFSTDTIRVSIPLNEAKQSLPKEKPAVEQNISSQLVNEYKPSTTTTPSVETTTAAPVIKTETPAPKKTTLTVMNSDCKNFASDHDVDKLRVKIISEYAIEDKLLAAKKVFKQRCFSVKQIRALTELFPSDETKYQFFDAAYPFVSDSSDFYQLEELIKNDYYKNRFKAMIHK